MASKRVKHYKMKEQQFYTDDGAPPHLELTNYLYFYYSPPICGSEVKTSLRTEVARC